MALSFIYNVLKDVTRAVRSRNDKNVKTLEARRHWEPLFYKEVYRCWNEALRKDAVVVDIRHLKAYSDGNVGGRRKGISEWFRVGLVQALSDEFALLLTQVYLKPLEEGWVKTRYDDPDPSTSRAFVVAFVKYEQVVDVSWDGDKFTNLPVIYCRFQGRERGTPYDRVMLCTEGGDERFPPQYFEFAHARDMYQNGVIPREIFSPQPDLNDES